MFTSLPFSLTDKPFNTSFNSFTVVSASAKVKVPDVVLSTTPPFSWISFINPTGWSLDAPSPVKKAASKATEIASSI